MGLLSTAAAMTFLNFSNKCPRLLAQAAGSCLSSLPKSKVGQSFQFFGTTSCLQIKRGPVGKIKRYKYPPTTYRRTIEKPESYTTEPIDVQMLGGRHYKTGKQVLRSIGGGLKHKFYWVDFNRVEPLVGKSRPGSEELVERVMAIKVNDLCRTGHIALVASGDKKRWILATNGTKVGDVIKSTTELPRIPVKAVKGNSHPLGALTVGTVVHSIECYPGEGAELIRAAGSCGQILRKVDGQVIVRLPSKHEISVSEHCNAVVGQVSNPGHSSVPLGTAQANRWLGNRPSSGLWHRKDGYCGRKIHPPRAVKVYKRVPKPNIPVYDLMR